MSFGKFLLLQISTVIIVEIDIENLRNEKIFWKLTKIFNSETLYIKLKEHPSYLFVGEKSVFDSYFQQFILLTKLSCLTNFS